MKPKGKNSTSSNSSSHHSERKPRRSFVLLQDSGAQHFLEHGTGVRPSPLAPLPIFR